MAVGSTRLCAFLLVGLFTLTTATSAEAGIQNVMQWKIAEGGNGHWYGFMNANHSWSEAATLVSSVDFEGHVGYLATVTSQAENDFLLSVLSRPPGMNYYGPSDQFWLGGMRNPDDFDEWMWITGEDFTYTNWNNGEPNAATQAETVLGIFGPEAVNRQTPGHWNDADGSSTAQMWAAIEFSGPFTATSEPPTTIPEPATLLLFAGGLVGAGLIRYRRR